MSVFLVHRRGEMSSGTAVGMRVRRRGWGTVYAVCLLSLYKLYELHDYECNRKPLTTVPKLHHGVLP